MATFFKKRKVFKILKIIGLVNHGNSVLFIFVVVMRFLLNF
jgi:hypothetical protein